jgi:hypothetical protein
MLRDERWKQVVAGLAVLVGVSLLFILLAVAGHLPGLAGEFFGRILGMLTTPFILETSLCILGFLVVMLLNYWNQFREGDELVYLDQVKDGPADLPDQARWAVYKSAPLEPGTVDAADLLEGAVAIGDHDGAVEILATMSDEERVQANVLKSRIQLAEATGKSELAAQLKAQLGDSPA